MKKTLTLRADAPMKILPLFSRDKGLRAFFLVLLGVFLSINAVGQRHHERYDGPLPDFEGTGKLLLIGIVLLAVGFFVVTSSNPDKKGGSTFSILGMLILFGGLLCVLPLLLYVERIANAILGVVLILGLILIGGFLVWNWISK